ncbi:Uu.00g096800.m01.CDS01 [Anthostomella pinea]|uniref:U3 small nucleolar ribonucleoprotein protein IMP3 n=1 Tax=Anthostomella pinea TaxID=933095 RepID=A0AAI8VDA0_9PEZI|nr:Uu.00g096800.m01.CDS01 [Anthostomella pinea]
MVRSLKHHEGKLYVECSLSSVFQASYTSPCWLRKTDFITYKSDQGHRDAAVVRRYMIQKPEDYHRYNKICGSLRQLSHKISLLPPESPVRQKHEKLLLDKLYDMGILSSASKLSNVEHGATVSALARRRLPVVMTRLRMAETVQAATKLIEQGHVRVGVETITDPSFFVTRSLEDFITWTVGSKIKKSIMKYRDKLDDFELL